MVRWGTTFAGFSLSILSMAKRGSHLTTTSIPSISLSSIKTLSAFSLSHPLITYPTLSLTCNPRNKAKPNLLSLFSHMLCFFENQSSSMVRLAFSCFFLFVSLFAFSGNITKLLSHFRFGFTWKSVKKMMGFLLVCFGLREKKLRKYKLACRKKSFLLKHCHAFASKIKMASQTNSHF